MRRIPPGAPIVTAAEMRAAEQACFDTGISQQELMERAGLAVAREVRRLAAGQPILVLAGPGNNGGDAYVAARLLADWGHDVTVAALDKPKGGAAAYMAARWTGPVTDLLSAIPRAILVDGLFGTGASRAIEPELRATLEKLRGGFVIAIDLPSGLAADADTGDMPPIPAGVTVALGALKPAHVVGPGAGHCGHVLLADIGVPIKTRWRSLPDPLFPDPLFTLPRDDSHKYTRGLVLVVSGAMPGAARLAARAALAGGAGYVMLAGCDLTPGPLDAIVHRQVATPGDLAALLHNRRIGAVVIGPGLGTGDAARAMLDAALASACDLVLDGDALGMIGDALASRTGRVYLTPHAGEFARLFGMGEGSKIARTVAAAKASGTTIVHKGSDTVIADAAGRVTVAAGASPWLSTAGTGDVLAGLLAARHAGRDEDAAAAAVWLHMRAAALAGPSFSADALIDQVPRALSSGGAG